MTRFDDETAIARFERRLGTFVRRFEVLSPGMADLPLYNDKVAVEAVDFMPFGEMGFGALVTPWFVNLVFLPLELVDYDINRIGETKLVELPAGRRSFALGGDEVAGMFWAHSIMSPLPETTTHDGAVRLARSGLAAALTKPTGEAQDERAAAKSRREFMLGPSSDLAAPR